MDRLEQLKAIISKYDSAVIAFSGGVDSTFLAVVAGDVLRGKVLLVTALSSTYPASEKDDAARIAAHLKLPHRFAVSEELDIPGFSENTPERCYFCKQGLFTLMCEIARTEGLSAVFEGGNVDDLSDYRPGRKAIRELNIVSPLREAGFTKTEIREYSHRFGLPTAQKPAYACLASRFPYGEHITKEKLDRVGNAEQALRDMGFSQLRVRSHGNLARVELCEQELERGWAMRSAIAAACRKAGFTFVAVDCDGYRAGAMNEVLSPEIRKKNT